MDECNRREFQLSAIDQSILDLHYKQWETVVDNQKRLLIINDFELPKGYNVSHAKLALILPASYPDVQIDMAYFIPALARIDGKQIRKVTSIQLDGRTWQQWSRHRVGPDSWRSEQDNIETHLFYVIAFLTSELKKP